MPVAVVFPSARDGVARDLPVRVRPAPVSRGAYAVGDRVALRTSIELETSATAEAAIRRGEHQVHVVDGVRLRFPSQRLGMIESSHPAEPGQTHDIARHIGANLAANIARLQRDPFIRAAGGYVDLARAQRATDRTIAQPVNQQRIAVFLATPGQEKIALDRVDLREDVGASTLRSDLDAGHPRLIPGRTATVVLVRDASFPEGYRVLTSYPDTRPPQAGAWGSRSRDAELRCNLA